MRLLVQSNRAITILPVLDTALFPCITIHYADTTCPYHYILRVVDDAKCIVFTRVYVSVCVCVSVCLPVRGRTPTLLHVPGCNLAAW